MASDETIRSIAHPLRWRILTQLRQGGPQTATQLAAALDTNSGSTSYHLRKLAETGAIHDTGGGTGRRREWAASDETTQWMPSAPDEDDDTATSLNWLEHDVFRHFAEKYAAWLDVRETWPRPWREAAGASDYPIVVTAEQLAAMNDEIWAVLEKYRRAGAGNPSALRVAAYVHCYPIDLERTPRA